MKTALFDFLLPERLIALRPAVPREDARLLVIDGHGGMAHRRIRDLPEMFRANDALTVNDSKVIHARLMAIRPSRLPETPDVPVELTLHKREGSDRYLAFAQPARRLRPGDTLNFADGLTAQVIERSGPEVLLGFNRMGAALDAAIDAVGSIPLPPYIAKNRKPDKRDEADYQTIYAGPEGSVAAPTAGLHFTPELIQALAHKGIAMVHTTLHVGAGTFLPVSSEDTETHRMHSERALLTAAAAERLNSVRAGGGRIAAVGTTALRTLESAADGEGRLHAFDSDTSIFITPGYRFKAVDMLLTNFHLPRSTLFMLVSAFMGLEVMQAAYAEAIREEYRFYSYGDACLLIRSP